MRARIELRVGHMPSQKYCHQERHQVCDTLQASRRAILNANYMAKRLEDHFNVLYRCAVLALALTHHRHLSLMWCLRPVRCLQGHTC